jgi:nitrate reductase (cytochrome), electron transfer subunit
MITLRRSLFAFAGIIMAGGIVLAQDLSWTDEEIGFGGSVFETPDPTGFDYISIDPEDADTTLPVAFDDAPPLIPHSVEESGLITLKSNKCLKCHHDQDLWDQEKDAAEPSPMPESHYVSLRTAPDVIAKKIIGARYFCTQCHVAQTEVELLVENDF